MDMDASKQERPPLVYKRRWYQYSLRSLLLLGHALCDFLQLAGR